MVARKTKKKDLRGMSTEEQEAAVLLFVRDARSRVKVKEGSPLYVPTDESFEKKFEGDWQGVVQRLRADGRLASDWSHVAYKFRAYPTPEQRKKMWDIGSHCRGLYNHLVVEQQRRWDLYRQQRDDGVDKPDVKFLRRGSSKDPETYTYGHFCALKTEHAWMREIPGVIANAVCDHFVKATKRYLSMSPEERRLAKEKRERRGRKPRPRKDKDGNMLPPLPPGFPRKHKRSGRVSFTIPYSLRVDWAEPLPGQRRYGVVSVPSVGYVRFRKHREIRGQPMSATFSYVAGHWYVSLCCRLEDPLPRYAPTKRDEPRVAGIDLNVSDNILMASDGWWRDPFAGYRGAQKKRTRLMRKNNRLIAQAKERGEKVDWRNRKNFQKRWNKIRRLEAKIARAREDYLQKVALEVARRYDIVVLEDLKIKNMVASAKGSVEEPGTKVRQKAGLNKAILDQGLARLRVLIKQKVIELGGAVYEVDPRGTSKTCSACGEEGIREGIRFWCPHCGLRMHADLNAAINILNRWTDGQSVTINACRAERPISRPYVMTQEQKETVPSSATANGAVASQPTAPLATQKDKYPEWLEARFARRPNAKRIRKRVARSRVRKQNNSTSLYYRPQPVPVL